MPRVPLAKQGQRINPSNPTGFQSASAARRSGEILGNFGGAVAKFGKEVEALEARQNAASAKLAERDLTQFLTTEMDALVTDIKHDTSSQFSDEENYQTFSEGIRADALRQMDIKYKGKYSQNFGLIADEIINGKRNTVQVQAYDKENKKIKKAVVDTATRDNGNVYTNPDNLDDILSKAVKSNDETMETFGASMKKRVEAKDQVVKKLTHSAISGLIAQGNSESFLKARDIVTNRYGQFYNNKEMDTELARIDKAQLTFMKLTSKNEKELRKEQEDQHKKLQEKHFIKKTTDLAQAAAAGKGALVAKLESEIVDLANKGKLSGSQTSSLLQKTDKGYKKTSSISSYDIAKKVYRAYEGKDYNTIRADIKAMVERGDMTTAQATDWERQMVARQKAFQSSPQYKAEYKGYQKKLDAFQQEKDIFAKIGLGMDTKRRIDKDANGEYALKAFKLGPKKAYEEVLATHYSNVAILGGAGGIYPRYGREVKTKEDLKSLLNWAKSADGVKEDSTEYRKKFAPYYKKAVGFVSLQERIKAIQDEEAKQESRTPQSFDMPDMSEELIQQLKDIDSEQPDEVSWINQEPFNLWS